MYILAYADDIVLIAEEEEMKSMMERLDAHTAQKVRIQC